MKKRHPGLASVVERNRPYDTFGWGVVFSDLTLENLRQWDPDRQTDQRAFNHWDDIELWFKGQSRPSGRPRLRRHRPAKRLNILQERCLSDWAWTWCSKPT
ncbi:MAG: hypothetical protein IPF39_12040 [Comamonadaceae bacterium]|uniref:hypothetical protein n=1 Tax=Candidatus Skiveiella danica TaxID=3386177 RepID=UPI003909227B|nr:hypothetical protein [Comamonadaceae bacterium]